MSGNYVGLMAKYPEKGAVKTRLAQSIGDDRALSVYKNLLSDCIQKCTPENDDYILVPFVTPAHRVSDFNVLFSDMTYCFEQSGSSLGVKMINALSKLKETFTADKVILIGADIPYLNSTLISNALTMLDTNEIVIGPTTDGGYYLIGMNKIYPELFTDITFGTNTVFGETIKILVQMSLSYSMLPELSDLDTIEDLDKFPEYSDFLQ